MPEGVGQWPASSSQASDCNRPLTKPAPHRHARLGSGGASPGHYTEARDPGKRPRSCTQGGSGAPQFGQKGKGRRPASFQPNLGLTPPPTPYETFPAPPPAQPPGGRQEAQGPKRPRGPARGTSPPGKVWKTPSERRSAGGITQVLTPKMTMMKTRLRQPSTAQKPGFTPKDGPENLVSPPNAYQRNLI